MKVFIAVTLFGLTLAAPNSQVPPNITVEHDRSLSAIPKIGIVFPDGHEDRMILKKHFVSDEERELDASNCNFLGRLEKDKEACLAVTGCPGEEMEFTIHSIHNVDTNKYVLHPSGNVELTLQADRPMDKIKFEDIPQLQELNRASGTCTLKDISGCKQLPPTNEIRLKASAKKFINSNESLVILKNASIC